MQALVLMILIIGHMSGTYDNFYPTHFRFNSNLTTNLSYKRNNWYTTILLCFVPVNLQQPLLVQSSYEPQTFVYIGFDNIINTVYVD